MKVLATSDMHGRLDGIDLAGVDLAVFAGDIAPLKGITAWDAYDQLYWMNHDFYEWCNAWKNTQIVFTPGNHDFFALIKSRFGPKLRGHSLDLKLASNASMLVDKCISIHTRDEAVQVYGTPWVPIISHRWAYEAEHDVLVDKFSLIPSGVDILISHSPPRLDYIDVSLAYGIDSDKFGSHELSNAIAAKEPKMCFCGHIHTGSHSMSTIGKTHVWNVSRVDEQYEIAFDPTIVDAP